MNWSWLEPAVWVGLALLALEIVALFTLAWRAPHRMAMQRAAVQIRQAIDGLKTDTNYTVDLLDALEAQGKTLDAIRDMLDKAVER